MLGLSLLFMILCWLPFRLAHYDPAYMHSSGDSFESFEDWMGRIRDDVMLSEIAMPGTHDSSTFTSSDHIVGTQALNFEEQLRYGVRVFDIRYRHTSNKFALHHAFVFLNMMFGDFLDRVQEFLEAHPSETVLFRLKKDHDDGDDNTRSHQDTLKDYLSQYNTYKQTTTNIPLGEARGKFIILNDHQFHDAGIPYSASDIQDEYKLSANWDLYWKYEKVRDHINKAKDGDPNTFYINYLSAAYGGFPYFFASGHSSPGTSAERLATGYTTPGWMFAYADFPRVSCFIGICTIAYEGTNILGRDRIYDVTNSRRTVGIIMADFIGTSLIKETINNNFKIANSLGK